MKPVGDGELVRLEHLRDLIGVAGTSDSIRLLLFSRSGFTRELRAVAAGRRDVELVDLERMYHGD